MKEIETVMKIYVGAVVLLFAALMLYGVYITVINGISISDRDIAWAFLLTVFLTVAYKVGDAILEYDSGGTEGDTADN